MDTDDSIADEIIRLANMSDEPEFFGKVSDDVSKGAEDELGLKFPKSYRVFLRNFGAARMLRHQFDGLPDTRNTDDEMPDYLHVVDSTKSCFEDLLENRVASGYIHITSDEGSYEFFLDTSKTVDDECPVVAWGPGAEGLIVADDFLGFLSKLAAKVKLF